MSSGFSSGHCATSEPCNYHVEGWLISIEHSNRNRSIQENKVVFFVLFIVDGGIFKSEPLWVVSIGMFVLCVDIVVRALHLSANSREKQRRQFEYPFAY